MTTRALRASWWLADRLALIVVAVYLRAFLDIGLEYLAR